MGRKSKATVRRQEILSHFYQVIIDEGFEGASIAKIAKRMEVNPSLLIHYFSTKDAMVVGLIDYIMTTYSPTILPDFSETADPEERWQDVLDVISQMKWDRIMNHKVFYSCYALGLRLPEVMERFEGLYQSLLERIETEVLCAAEAGLIKIESPRKAAEFIMTLAEGRSFLQHVTGGEEGLQSDPTLFRKLAHEMLSSGIL
ncbi:MAG: TetR/AcrR family transcriptional regulator [Bacteroidota bacterium]